MLVVGMGADGPLQLSPTGGAVLDAVLRHAAERPSAEAVKDDEEVLSYRELGERVEAVAAGLHARGVQPGDRVALAVPNSASFFVAALGCLWIGAAFVPLSVDDPPARQDRVLANSAPRLLLTHRSADRSRSAATEAARGAVELGDLMERAGPVPPRSTDSRRDAYLIYTSGSTGEPKGVRTPASAFRWAVTSAAAALGLDASTRALCVSPFHFDGAYGTAFPTLLAGGTIVVPRREELVFGKRFYRTVLEEGITHTGFTPSYLRLLLASPRMAHLARSEWRSLGLGGEECVAADVARLWKVLPELRVFNRYGPTETTIQVTTYEAEPADVALGRVPIGLPHPGVTFHVMRGDGSLVEGAGEAGELCIGGVQLMAGYWRDPSLTASVLRRHEQLGWTLYRTGDLAYRDERGRYVYAGRQNGVVKRGGVRISLEEVARVLRGGEGVTGAWCVPTDDNGRLAVVAVVESTSGVTPPELLDRARRELPGSMLPDEMVVVPSLPLGRSGKVDRDALVALAERARAQRSN